ncbi:hypothetical protein L2E82_35221 [Cichorium intybus]|uniref:Uncharacterized protein n=1 Tax=Cichorium intybus TaxID=13427 RepID=A0ACB9BNG4_CICIN|nr:hypothetical protein L2E82_35221 [Cichorium intybus]
MERQIGQMAADQQKRDSGKLPSATEVNPTHNQRPGKEQVNTVESGWQKVTLEDLFEVGSEVRPGKEEKALRSEEGKEEGISVENETQPEIDKEVHQEEQPTIAGIKQKKKNWKGKTKQEAPKSMGPLMNQPLWDELKDAPEDTRILQEMCEQNGRAKHPHQKL